MLRPEYFMRLALRRGRRGETDESRGHDVVIAGLDQSSPISSDEESDRSGSDPRAIINSATHLCGWRTERL